MDCVEEISWLTNYYSSKNYVGFPLQKAADDEHLAFEKTELQNRQLLVNALTALPSCKPLPHRKAACAACQDAANAANALIDRFNWAQTADSDPATLNPLRVQISVANSALQACEQACVPPQPPPPPPPKGPEPQPQPQPKPVGTSPSYHYSSCPPCQALAAKLNDAADSYARSVSNGAHQDTIDYWRNQMSELSQQVENCEKQCAPPIKAFGIYPNIELVPGPPETGMMVQPGTGFYTGGFVTGSLSGVTAREQEADPPHAVTGSFHDDPLQAGFGGRGGYDWPLSENWRLGPMIDLYGPNDTVNHPFTGGTYLRSTVDFTATAKARLGYLALPDTMLYATAGVAVGNQLLSLNISGPTSSHNQMTPGGALGAGIEWALFSADKSPFHLPTTMFLDYDHIWWGDAHFNTPTASPFFNYTWARDSNIVKLGLTLHLGEPGPPPPEVAPARAGPLPLIPARPMTPVPPARGQLPQTQPVAALAPMTEAALVAVRREAAPAPTGETERFTIRFDDKMAALTPTGIKALEAAAAALREGRLVEIAIEGCGADADMSRDSACRRRAGSVRQLLALRGVKPPHHLIVAEVQ